MPKDDALAVKWWRKAAEQGIAQAQCNLGRSYCLGTGVTKDWVEGIKWCRMAAEQGIAYAQAVLGAYYNNVGGGSHNYPEAAKWFRKAAEQGLASSQVELGSLYFAGHGVQQDYKIAAEMFRKAAERGNADGQANLGMSYVFGWGVPKDYVEAYKWLNLALAQRNKKAIEYFPIVEQEMTPDQIAEAQQLTRAFKPTKPPEPNSSVSGKVIFDSNPSATGTGFFITDDGYLISNNHVVKDATGSFGHERWTHFRQGGEGGCGQ